LPIILGNGANMAIMDGIDLAEALRTSESLATARTSYEKQANGRSSKAVKVSHITIAIAHATGWKLWFYKFFLHIINFLMGRG
jgi:2-polyprenyl-6-methoxyphenol hydroxylase-like FAD-dependent oxidoreductase